MTEIRWVRKRIQNPIHRECQVLRAKTAAAASKATTATTKATATATKAVKRESFR